MENTEIYSKWPVSAPPQLINAYESQKIGAGRHLLCEMLGNSKEMPKAWRILKRHCKTEFEWIAIFNLIVWARRTALNKYKPKKIKTKHGQKYLEKRHYENIAKKALQLASTIVKFDADMRLPDLLPENYVSFLGKYSSVLDAIESFLEMARKNNPTCFEKIIEKSEFLISTGRNELLDASIYRLFWTQGFHAVWEPNFKAVASCDDWPPSLSLMLKKYSEYSIYLSEQAMLVSRPNQRSLSGDLATRAFIFLLGTRLRIEYGQAMYDTVAAITNALFQHPPDSPTTKARVQSILKQVS